MKALIFSLCILNSLSAQAWSSSSVETSAETSAETVIEVSIYDLISKPRIVRTPKTETLPLNYGNEVAKVIASAKPKLINCMEEAKVYSTELKAILLIESSGKASVAGEGSEIPGCMASILLNLNYPKHTLSHAVKVVLPLKLSRKMAQ